LTNNDLPDINVGGLVDGEYEVFIQRVVVELPTDIFADGFESGGTTAWSLTVP